MSLTSPFSAEQFAPPMFSARLRALLDRAREVLALDAVAVAELSAQDGVVAPAWRQWSPLSSAPAALQPALFEQLTCDAQLRPASRAEQEALGAPFDPELSTTLMPLSLTPRLSRSPDALLVATHAPAVDATPALWLELRSCLEHALSQDRQHRLAATIFQAVEQAADPIELTDRQARLIYANAAWEKTFGYVARDVVGQTVGRLFRDPVAPIHDTAFYQFTLATLAEGGAWSGALACRTRDGQRVFCEPMVSPFSAAQQGFAGNFAVRRSLAQRAQRDAALAIAHHEFRAVLAAIPDGVTVLRDGKIYFVNAAFLQTLGRSEQSVVGLALTEFVHPEDRAQLLQDAGPSPKRLRLLREDGSIRYVEISTAGAVSFEGEPATILLSRDVTEQRVAEEQLARAERLSALGRLAAGVAHEINNPLTYVALNLQRIQRANLLDEQQRAALTEAIDGTTRIQHIVAELRSYSGPDSPGPPQPVEIAKAVTSAINIAQNEIRHRARLQRQLEPGMHVLAREGQLVQVLVNLLVNAAQAIPASAAVQTQLIRVSSCAVSNGVVRLEVSDTGVGIAPNLLVHVLEPFSSTKSRGEGLGLGLAISKRIVESLGGSISIRSCLGQGTCVRVELPRALARQSDSTIQPASPHRAGAPRSLRLLIVDDEATIANTLRSVFGEHDAAVALEATQAIEHIKSGGCFDLVLCDLMMPGMTGPELYRIACQLDPALHSRFVFMTGGAFTDEIRAFLQNTCCPVLTKPFTIERAFDMVDEITGRNKPHT